MKDLFNKYIDNVKSFKDYSLKEIFLKVVPQGNQVILNQSNNKEIIKINIFVIILLILGTIFEQSIEMAIKLPFFESYTHPFKTVFNETVMAHLSSIIILLVFSLIVPVGIVYYLKNYGQNKQKTWFSYVLIIYSIFMCVKSTFEILGLFKNIFKAFIFVILFMAVKALIVLVNLTVLKYSIDECINAYNQNTKDISGSLETTFVNNISSIKVEDDGSSTVNIEDVRRENESYTDISELEVQEIKNESNE